ncbi:ATP synthase F0 subunit B [Candidatus Electronema sp. PJ]|uniref:ATP synthase F0 subunit B n=1 Tax=Candidatus Electronema sp. PJ TaxID=3401572 RepID=UPI003AA7B592
MISIDSTVFIHIINMIVLMVVLNRVLYKPILAIMDKRQENKDAMTGDVEHFEQQARDHQALVDKKMHEASIKAKKALDTAKSEAETVGAEKIAAIRAEADSEKEQQLAEIRASFDVARRELLDDINSVAQDMAAKILGRSVRA